jgi:hypothetical protein
MRTAVLILLVLAVPVVAGERTTTCAECGARFDRSGAVRWGSKSFCSSSCKESFAAEDDERGWPCEICGAHIRAPRREYVSGDTRYVWLNDPPKTQQYCVPCQRDIRSGKIDPDDPPLLSPRTAEEYDEENPSENPYAPKARPDKGKKKDARDEEAHSGFGALTYVVVIAGVLFALLRWFLK